jgi:hypothetical protein
MPRNKYGPDDPEMRGNGDDGNDGSREPEPNLFPPLAAKCACGAPAVTMRVASSDPKSDKVKLVARCAACAAKDGEAEKRAILKEHRKRHKVEMERLNEEMLELYRRRLAYNRATAFVTVMDARRAYRRMPDSDPNARLQFFGGFFNGHGWHTNGQRAKNSDEGNHARPVECWVRPEGEA